MEDTDLNNQMQQKQPQKVSFSSTLNSGGYQKMLASTLQDDKRRQRFIASITSAVAVNPVLQECDPSTVVSAALVGESLGLSPSPQLGQFYMVPFNNTKKGCKDAQFQIGYKGYIQLALRTGAYKKLNVIAVKKGELIKFDRLNEEIVLSPIENELEWEAAQTVGYYAMFEYTNGFKKALYWSREKMESHAMRYSKGYAVKKGYTFWEKDFDGMAYKTMLRQLISKWGIMSTEMVSAIESDQQVETMEQDYFDQSEPLAASGYVTGDKLLEPLSPQGDVVSMDDL